MKDYKMHNSETELAALLTVDSLAILCLPPEMLLAMKEFERRISEEYQDPQRAKGAA